MTEFQAFAPDVEVSGAAVLAILQGMGDFRALALEFLAKQGIGEPEATAWYSQQAWLNAFRDIARELGPATLQLIGSKIPQTALWPLGIDSVERALASIDVAYHMNHRRGEIGHYRFEQGRRHSGTVVCNNPYPCPFDLGIIQGTTRRYAPSGSLILVLHDRSQPCRQTGGESCTYKVSW